VLQQLQEVTRKAEAAEKLAEELRARAEAAEAQLRAIPDGNLGARVNALEAELKDERARRRAADWVRLRLRRASDAPAGADHQEYLAALDEVAEGRAAAALERLKKLVARVPANVHYRTALHLTEGFHLQQQGQDAELTARFERARLVEAAHQK